MKVDNFKKSLPFIIPIIFLLILSLLNMYGASFISSLYKNAFKRQLVWIIVGTIVFIAFLKINKNTILKYINYIYVTGVISLFLVLLFGTNINGASSWFKIGPFSMQPSELFKPFFIVFLSSIVNNHNGKSITLLFKILLFTFIPTLLIFLQPDTGVVMMYLLIMLGVLIASPVKKWQTSIFIVLAFSLIISFLSLYFFNKDLFVQLFGSSFFYRIDRLIDYKNNSSYQLTNALIGIGSAGIFGYGLIHPKIYVPEIITDFVFDLTILNFGYIIGIIVIGLYLYILFKIYKLYSKSSNVLNKCILLGIFLLMLFQIFEHIFMNLGITPITGITLPFLSYGGSSLISYFLIVGLIINYQEK